MNQSNPVVLFIVRAIAILTGIGVCSLCASLFLHTYADPQVLTSLITLTAGLAGSLTTLLTKMGATPPADPPKVQVEQPADKPIPTKETP